MRKIDEIFIKTFKDIQFVEYDNNGKQCYYAYRVTDADEKGKIRNPIKYSEIVNMVRECQNALWEEILEAECYDNSHLEKEK